MPYSASGRPLVAAGAPSAGFVRLFATADSLRAGYARLEPGARFQYALIGSILLHAVVMFGVSFSHIDKNRVFREKPLEVVLVNSRTESKPVKADARAQANLDGGGNTDAERRARTPLPVARVEEPTQELAVKTRRIEDLEREAKRLMTQSQTPAPAVDSADTRPQPRETEKIEAPVGAELVRRSLEIARLEAQIARDMDAYQKRPRRRFIGARTEEYRFARYIEDWRHKVERVGTVNYPSVAREQGIFGVLQVTVEIRNDGKVTLVEINRSSGHKVLDEAARRIIHLAEPFAAFPPDIAKDTDVISITRNWMFTRNDQFQSE